MSEKQFNCPVEATLSVISGKYKAIILYHLINDGTLRYSQLQKCLPKATPKMLTAQLRELESAKIIQRKIYPVVPPKTEYSITEFGKTLTPIINELCDWGKKHMAGTF